MKGVRSWEERAPRSAHRLYVVVGLLCLVAFGLIVGAYLEENPPPLGASDPAPADLAPPAPPVLVELDGQPIAPPAPPPPMTCDELARGRDAALERASRGTHVAADHRQALALTAFAWVYAVAECDP